MRTVRQSHLSTSSSDLKFIRGVAYRIQKASNSCCGWTASRAFIERSLRLETTLGVPDQALGDEVHEEVVVAAQNLLKRLGAWTSPSTLRVHNRARGARLIYKWLSQLHISMATVSVRTKEQSPPRATVDEVLVRYTEDFHDTRQLFLFILTGEDGESRKQLRQDAT